MQLFRVPHDWTVSFWPGHTQNSCWNPNLQGVNGTRGREPLCGHTGRAHVIGTSVLPAEDPERTVVTSCCWPWFWTSDLHSCQNQIPVVDKLLTALYLTIASHKQRELKVQEGQQSPCNLETSSPSLCRFLKAPPQNLRSNGPARTSARNSRIPGRETPGQVWERVALFQDLSMWLRVTQNPMLFTLAWTHHPVCFPSAEVTGTTTPDSGHSTSLR